MSGIGSAGRWSLLVAGLLLLVASAPADGRKVTLTAADVGYIESDGPRPEGRILARFELPEVIRLGDVEFAVLELRARVTADEGVSCVVVDAFPLTAEWDGATVSWDASWSTPGGDYDRVEHAVWIARPGEDSILRFDATEMVAGWASGAIPNNGLVLMTSPGWPGAIGASDAHGVAGHGPVLEVRYSPDRGSEH
jgi:hypothetical protein